MSAQGTMSAQVAPPAPPLDEPPPGDPPPLGSQVGQHSPGKVVEGPSQAMSGHAALQYGPLPAVAPLPPAPDPAVPAPPAPAAPVPENVPPQAVAKSAAAKATVNPCCLRKLCSKFICRFSRVGRARGGAGDPGDSRIREATQELAATVPGEKQRFCGISRAGVGTVRHEADLRVRAQPLESDSQARRRRRATTTPSSAKAPKAMPFLPCIGGLKEHLVVVFEPLPLVVVTVPFPLTAT
jgi:hypothetical protein